MYIRFVYNDNGLFMGVALSHMYDVSQIILTSNLFDSNTNHASIK